VRRTRSPCEGLVVLTFDQAERRTRLLVEDALDVAFLEVRLVRTFGRLANAGGQVLRGLGIAPRTGSIIAFTRVEIAGDGALGVGSDVGLIAVRIVGVVLLASGAFGAGLVALLFGNDGVLNGLLASSGFIALGLAVGLVVGLDLVDCHKTAPVVRESLIHLTTHRASIGSASVLFPRYIVNGGGQSD
jgi:hypothetical protein